MAVSIGMSPCSDTYMCFMLGYSSHLSWSLLFVQCLFLKCVFPKDIVKHFLHNMVSFFSAFSGCGLNGLLFKNNPKILFHSTNIY